MKIEPGWSNKARPEMTVEEHASASVIYVLAVHGYAPDRPPGWHVTQARVRYTNEDGSIMIDLTSGKGHNLPWHKQPGEYWTTEAEAQQVCDRRNEEMYGGGYGVREEWVVSCGGARQ